MFRLLISCLALTFATVSHAHGEPIRVGATFGKIYVPNGFDANDHVQIVGEGMFRNTCYRPAPGQVKVDEASKVISVGPVAYEYIGFCLQVILPFQRTVDVGILKPGTYQIAQYTGSSTQPLGEITIKPNLTDAPDDFLYAPIAQAFFKQNGRGADITLTGELASECMKFDYAKVDIQKDVIVIQPIAKLITQTSCKAGRYPFEEHVVLPSLPAGRYLLHVRSMNGNAINTLVQQIEL